MPTGAAQHVNGYLTNFGTGYGFPEFIADRVAPPLKVGKQSDLYRIWGAEGMNIPGNDLVAPGTPANEVDYTLSNTTYFANGHALKHPIPDRTVAANDVSRDALKRNGVFLTKRGVKLGQEKYVADLVQTAANYGSGFKAALSGTARWNSTAADPLANIETGRAAIQAATGFDPNTIIIPRDVWGVAKRMAAFTDLIKYTQTGVLTLDLFGKAVDIDNVLLGTTSYNTANPAQTVSLGRLWTNCVVLAYVDPAAGNAQSMDEARPTAFTDFVWTPEDTRGMAADDGSVVYDYREEPRHADVVEYELYYDAKNTFTGAAYLIYSVLS